jgi:hypothetical protein
VPRRKFYFVEHLVGRTHRTILRRALYGAPPPLDTDDEGLIESIRRTGKLDHGNSSEYFSQPTYYGDGFSSMREAEHWSRRANRINSAFFNDEMLKHWKKKWRREDRAYNAWRKQEEKQWAKDEAWREKRRAAAARAMEEHRKWAEEGERKRRELQREREEQDFSPCPNPKPGYVCYWNGYVVIAEATEAMLIPSLRKDLHERARRDGRILYWPNGAALRMLWPEEINY